MPTKLSTGIDLSALDPADLAALVLAAQRVRAGMPATEETSEKARTTCIVSPHTGACTRCGTPNGAAFCDAKQIGGHQFAARLDMRRKRA